MWPDILRIYPVDIAIQRLNNWDLVNSGINLYYSTKFLTKVADSKVQERGTQRNHLNGVSCLQMKTFLLPPHLNAFDRVSILLLQTNLHTKYPRNRQRKSSFVVFRPAWNWGYRRKWQCSSFQFGILQSHSEREYPTRNIILQGKLSNECTLLLPNTTFCLKLEVIVHIGAGDG